MKITRRYGIAPAQRCGTNNSCPDVLGLDNGDYLIIGKAPSAPHIPAKEFVEHAVNIGADEMAVVVPREVLHAAALEIAKEIAARGLADSKAR